MRPVAFPTRSSLSSHISLNTRWNSRGVSTAHHSIIPTMACPTRNADSEHDCLYSYPSVWLFWRWKGPREQYRVRKLGTLDIKCLLSISSYIPVIGVLSFLLWYRCVLPASGRTCFWFPCRPIYNGYMKVIILFASWNQLSYFHNTGTIIILLYVSKYTVQWCIF